MKRQTKKTASATAARVIKIIDRPRTRIVGVFRKNPNGGGGRIESVDKKMLGKEIAIPSGADNDAQDGELVAVETQRASRLGLPTGRIVEKLGSLASEKTISLIAIHAHQIPDVFRRETIVEAENAKPATLSGGREDWRKLLLITIDPPDAKDHDDAVYAETDTSGDNNGGHIVTVAIADVAHYVTPGSALDREALVRGNSVYSPTASCQCCPSASRTICARCGRTKTAPRSPCV